MLRIVIWQRLSSSTCVKGYSNKHLEREAPWALGSLRAALELPRMVVRSEA